VLPPLDEIDRRILRALQRNGRIANNDLAREVGLSPSPCLRRVRALEESGLIDRYVAILDSGRLGLGQTFFTRIWLSAQDEGTISRFTAAIMTLPEVLECYIMLGDCDAMIRVQAADISAYRRFQSEKLSRIESVRNVKSDVPSQIVKQTTELPI
jgi:Lrp/AsnC family transcriptional regulator, leucine-responsive regulatory protein